MPLLASFYVSDGVSRFALSTQANYAHYFKKSIVSKGRGKPDGISK
ncbi:MAG: hypothetical protein ACJA1I_001040 [Zhongshania marina]|jgi:hypothetical protein